MRQHALTALILALTLGPILDLNAQQQTPDTTGTKVDPQAVVVRTSEVRIDAVVKDKKGRPVKDLTAVDFEVYEDGVRQEVQSFRQVGGEEPIAAKGAKPEKKEGSPATLGANYLALVFDRLSPGARVLAHDSALKVVNDGVKPNDFVGVFGTALSLNIFQHYTNNGPLIKAAIDRAGLQTGGEFTSSRPQLSKDRQELQGLRAQPLPTNGPPDPASISRMAELKAEIQTLETFADFESDRQGFATTDGLLALVNSFKNVDGRKSIIFFSEGITIPPAVQAHFQSVIASANRAGVTIYTVDAAGLRTESGLAETRKEIESRSAARLAELGTTDEGSGGAMTKGLERNERILLTLNPESGLGQLADQTGGMFIRDSNDLKTRMGQIGDDMNSYYVLTYIPQDRSFDGKFRKTEVKLKRGGLNIQTRKGYFAINSSYASPVLEFEAPALAAVGNATQPHHLPVRSTALSFPESDRRGLVTVLAELPLSSISFHSDQKKQQYSTDFSLITLIKDGQGQVVRKLSKQYTLAGALDKLPLAQKGQVLYYRETELEPGQYTIQTVAYDALNNKAGVKEERLDLAGAAETSGAGEGNDENLRLSSLVILSRAEQLGAGETNSTNPLQVGGMQVYPLMEAVHKQASKQLPFYFAVYQGKAAEKNVPKITIELSRDGHLLAQIPGEAPAADATGRRQFIGALPLDQMPLGTYELKVTANDGKNNVSSSTHFSVEI